MTESHPIGTGERLKMLEDGERINFVSLRDIARLTAADAREAATLRKDEPLNMCEHGADRGSYCGYCGGYSKGRSA